MEYSVGRGVARCGLLCLHVGEFGEILHFIVFKGDPASVGGPKTRRLVPNEEHVVVRFSCSNP